MWDDDGIENLELAEVLGLDVDDLNRLEQASPHPHPHPHPHRTPHPHPHPTPTPTPNPHPNANPTPAPTPAPLGEQAFIVALNYGLSVTPSEYARYYFALRSICHDQARTLPLPHPPPPSLLT